MWLVTQIKQTNSLKEERAMQSGYAGCNLSSYALSWTGRPKKMETRLKQNRNSVKTVLQNKNKKKNDDDMCTCFTVVVLRKDP